MAIGEMSVKTSSPLNLTTCEYLNISVCPATTNVDSVSYWTTQYFVYVTMVTSSLTS